MSPVPAAVSPTNTFLQATLLTNKPIVNTIVEILVTCTEPMTYINYELLGRGDVVLSHTFQIDYTNVSCFRFTKLFVSTPDCCLHL